MPLPRSTLVGLSCMNSCRRREDSYFSVSNGPVESSESSEVVEALLTW